MLVTRLQRDWYVELQRLNNSPAAGRRRHCADCYIVDPLSGVRSTFHNIHRHSLSSRPSSFECWRQQLTIPVFSSSIAIYPLISPCIPSNLLCRWAIVFLVCFDSVFLPYFLPVQSVLAVRHFPLQHGQSTVASTWPLWPWVLFPHQVLQGYTCLSCAPAMKLRRRRDWRLAVGTRQIVNLEFSVDFRTSWTCVKWLRNSVIYL